MLSQDLINRNSSARARAFAQVFKSTQSLVRSIVRKTVAVIWIGLLELGSKRSSRGVCRGGIYYAHKYVSRGGLGNNGCGTFSYLLAVVLLFAVFLTVGKQGS